MADTLGGFNLQTTNWSDNVVTAIHRHMLANLRPGKLVYADAPSVIPLGPIAGTSFTHKATIVADFEPPPLSALSEGVPPSVLKLALDALTVTAVEVGEFTTVYSQADYQDHGAQGLVASATEKIGWQMARVFDEVARACVAAATPDLYGNNGAGADNLVTAGTNGVLNTKIIDEMVTQLRERDVMPYADGLYRLVAHPRVFKPLLEETSNTFGGFLNAANEGAVGDLKAGTIGAYHGVLFQSAGSRGIKLAGDGDSIRPVPRLRARPQAVALTDPGSITAIAQPGGSPTRCAKSSPSSATAALPAARWCRWRIPSRQGRLTAPSARSSVTSQRRKAPPCPTGRWRSLVVRLPASTPPSPRRCRFSGGRGEHYIRRRRRRPEHPGCHHSRRG